MIISYPRGQLIRSSCQQVRASFEVLQAYSILQTALCLVLPETTDRRRSYWKTGHRSCNLQYTRQVTKQCDKHSPCAADQGPQLPYSSKSSVHNSRLWFYFCFISKRKECELFGSGDALLKVNAPIDQILSLSTPS
jgi:hypothetical protein